MKGIIREVLSFFYTVICNFFVKDEFALVFMYVKSDYFQSFCRPTNELCVLWFYRDGRILHL